MLFLVKFKNIKNRYRYLFYERLKLKFRFKLYEQEKLQMIYKVKFIKIPLPTLESLIQTEIIYYPTIKKKNQKTIFNLLILF